MIRSDGLRRAFYWGFWLGLPLAWLSLAGGFLLTQVLPPPWPWMIWLPLLLLWGGAAALLVLAARRFAVPLAELAQVAHHIAQGRVEQRAASDLPPPLRPLAEALNNVGRILVQLRDHQEALVLQTTSRLKADQAHLQQMNSEMRRALLSTQAAAQTQSELFANLSHELRTPLTGIMGYADLLRRSKLDPEQEQYLETLDKSARGLLSMINDLLDWSRIEAGRLKLHEEQFEIHEVVEDVTTLLAPLAYQKDLELVRIVYHDVPTWLSGDPQRLRQVLTNLVSNAIKFTERGEVVLRVMRERDDERGIWLRFSVADTGVGISPEQQARLFQPFQQAGSTRGAALGSGLGLSISRKLATLMGGEIELDSTPRRGSVFSAVLPLRLPADPPKLAPDRRLAEQTVWVLEPHRTAGLALTHWLTFWGLEVVSFDSAEALERRLALAHPLPAAVVVGLHPREVEALRPVLNLCAERRPPLLALVASASLDVQLRLRALGAAACLSKSTGRQALLQTLVELTGRENTARPLSGQRAVIADNNLANLRYLALLCVELGLEVNEAQDGEQALALWETHQPAYVLLDARMPRLDGASCARRIRASEHPDRRPRIIAVSAHLEPEERSQFLKAGADHILLKPFDERQLLAALRPGDRLRRPPNSQVLEQDPEMLQLLAEELPLQMAELDQTFERQDLSAARDAAHQLRGTAAFYHLAALSQCAAALEERLTRVRVPDEAETERKAIREAVAAAREDIQQRLQQVRLPRSPRRSRPRSPPSPAPSRPDR